jgi:hypothetical protein
MWSRLVKIQYTELKLSCGNDPVVKNFIHSNGDLWPNDPKINRVLPLPQGNHVAKFGKYPIYRTKVIVWKPVWTPARHTQSHIDSIKKKNHNSKSHTTSGLSSAIWLANSNHGSFRHYQVKARETRSAFWHTLQNSINDWKIITQRKWRFGG